MINTKTIEKLNSKLNNIVRIGKVVELVADKGKVRVEFGEKNIISRELYVMQCHSTSDKYYSMPSIDEYVICLFQGGEDVGFVIGSFYNQAITPSESDENVTSVTFQDGTTIKYDKSESKYTADFKGDVDITTAGNINITCDADVTLTAENVSVDATKVDVKADDVVVDASNVEVKGSTINLGEGTEPMLLAQTFLTGFDAHTHTGNLGAPTTPPMTPMTPTSLSTTIKNS